MQQPKPNSNFTHYDLRWGSIANINRNATHPLAGAVNQAVVGAHKNRAVFSITGCKLQLFADYTYASDGNATFVISSFVEGPPGVEFDTALYTGAVAAGMPTAVLAFRHIFQQYLAAVASAPALTSCSAPAGMPRATPWLCGFSHPPVRYWLRERREEVLTVARLAGLALLEFCERGLRRTVLERGEITLDPRDFPELEEPS